MENSQGNNQEVRLSLASSIRQRLENSARDQLNANDFTISRVPSGMYKGKEMYFDPSVVSIGPYHRRKEKYQAMEHHKWGQLRDFLARNPETSIETYIENLKSSEDSARRCYFEFIDLSSDEFVEMLLLDGCYILEVFLKEWFKHRAIPLPVSITAPISANSRIFEQTPIDFLLLENQIPFFVLQTLFNNLNLREVNHSLITISLYFFCKKELSITLDSSNFYHLLHIVHHGYFHDPELNNSANVASSSNKSLFTRLKGFLKWLNPFKLFLLCMYYCWLGNQNHGTNSVSEKTVPCAKNLHEAGITFKRRTSARRYNDILYKDGVLEIPRISIEANMSILFMNLIAFEQCNLPAEKRVVTCYMSFMDDIIDTPEDVAILQQNGILESYLNSDSETAMYFNCIVNNTNIDNEKNHLAPVIKEVNKYCKSTWPRWRAKFIRDYIFSPWAVFSLIAALLLLTLTFIQTFYTVQSYYSHY